MSKAKVQHTVIGIANLNARSRFLAEKMRSLGRTTNNGVAKHHDKQVAKLAARRAGAPTNTPGFKRPGSMNLKKQG